MNRILIYIRTAVVFILHLPRSLVFPPSNFQNNIAIVDQAQYQSCVIKPSKHNQIEGLEALAALQVLTVALSK